MFNTSSAFPTVLEQLRNLASFFDLPIKKSKKELDELVYNKTIHPKKQQRFINDVWQEPINKLLPEIGKYFTLIEHFSDYQSMVAHISVDGLNRDELIPILAKYYFAPAAYWFIAFRLPEYYRFPDISDLLTLDKYSVETVFNWLEQDPVWQEYITSLDKDGKDKLNRWKRCEFLYSYQEIIRLGNKTNKMVWEKIKCWLLIARTLDAIRRNETAANFFLGLQQSHQFCQIEKRNKALFSASASLLQQEIVYRQQIANKEFAKKTAQSYAELRMIHLSQNKPKSAESKETAWRELTISRAVSEHFNRQESIKYHWDWLEARWHLLSGNLEKAVEKYTQAFDGALFRAGKDLEEIIQEALVAAAFLEIQHKKTQRKLLAHLKNAAVMFGYELAAVHTETEKMNHKEVVAEWEVDLWARAFGLVFPQQGWFEGTDYSVLHSRLVDLSVFEYTKIKPDYKNPNKVISIKGAKRMPQLVYFSMLWSCANNAPSHYGNPDEIFSIIQKLLNSGADVNKLSSLNESALLFALENLNLLELPCVKQNRKLFDLLVKYPHSRQTINTQTSKKQKYPLRLAVESGRADVVQQILEMGAEVDLVNFEKITPLYFCIGMLSKFNAHKAKELLQKVDLNNILQQEWFRRHSEKTFYTLQSAYSTDDKNNRLLELVTDTSLKVIEAQLNCYSSIKSLQQIVQLLLNAGANPNEPHNLSLIKGYTPLMLAIEGNYAEIFEMMVKAGGDTSLTFLFDGQKKSCADIKEHWGSEDILL